MPWSSTLGHKSFGCCIFYSTATLYPEVRYSVAEVRSYYRNISEAKKRTVLVYVVYIKGRWLEIKICIYGDTRMNAHQHRCSNRPRDTHMNPQPHGNLLVTTCHSNRPQRTVSQERSYRCVIVSGLRFRALLGHKHFRRTSVNWVNRPAVTLLLSVSFNILLLSQFLISLYLTFSFISRNLLKPHFIFVRHRFAAKWAYKQSFISEISTSVAMNTKVVDLYKFEKFVKSNVKIRAYKKNYT